MATIVEQDWLRLIDEAGGTGGGIQYHDRVVSSDPPKVSGDRVKFIDGSTFLKTTDYFRSYLEFTGTSGEVSSYGYGGVPWWFRNVTTSPGGYGIGNFTTPNWAYALSKFDIPSVVHAPDIPVDERNESVTKSLNKIADQKANIGENLATLGQTVRMFLNPSRALYNGLRTIYRDRQIRPFLGRSFRNLIRGGVDRKIASKYLEYVYGLKPLMQDLYNVAEFAREAGVKPLLLSAKGYSFRTYRFGEIKKLNPSADRWEIWTDGTVNSRTRCTLWAKISDSYSGTRTLNQLGLVNPADLIWELVPYSFVVDWFLPIGPVLQAFTAPAGLDFIDGSIARRASLAWRTSNYINDEWHDWTRVDQPATGRFRYEGYRRSRIDDWPRPGLWFDPDPLRLHKDGSDRVFKALALSIMSLPRS